MQYISELPKGVPIPQHKRDDAEEEEVDIGEEVLNSDFPTVEIEKDDVCGTNSSTTSNSSSYSSSGESGNSSGSASEDSVRSPYIEPKKLLISEL
ncbi:unnamed protein product [Cuscuta epithymum]|uniref:Uncharacterized protein n=1 Tax=Cuscuta epithymum TaxID=186058 RepID=A0AAV0G2D4_9ASTE|nr:unnamed protein product [Cuscuta epithymum]